MSIWTVSRRCGLHLVTAVTDRAAITTWVQHGRRARPWQIVGPRHARYRALRVAPVPPKTADLPRPGAAARKMAGRDGGTGALIEQRNARALVMVLPSQTFPAYSRLPNGG